MNPLTGWSPGEISFVGHDLQRPECILAERDGTLWTADGRGGVMRIGPDGQQDLVLQHAPGAAVTAATGGALSPEQVLLHDTLPNGLAFTSSGAIAVANFGTDAIEVMERDGTTTTILRELGGRPLGKMNFVLVDSRDRMWFTVHTRMEPWNRAINERRPDGYVGLIDERGARIVADGFVGTNEIRLDAAEEWLYVVESNARHISRLRVGPDGSLSDREIYGPDNLGGTPDGFAFDAYGNLWVTLILAERLIAVTPDRDVLTILDDGDAERIAAYDEEFYAGTVTPEAMARVKGTLAPWMSSVTFGGPDLSTVYLGSLLGTTLPAFRSPVPGLAPAHW